MTPRSRPPLAFALSLLLLFAAGESPAQRAAVDVTGRALERLEEQTRRARSDGGGGVIDETREDEASDAEASAEGLSDEALLPSLRGVRLVGHPRHVSPELPVHFAEPRVEASTGFDRVPPPEPSVLAAVEPYLGQPVSMRSLQSMTEVLIEAYRATDHLFVDIYLPPQNVTGGVIQFVVLEAVLGELSIEGAVRSDPDYLRRQMRIDPGDRLNRPEIEDSLDFLNESPFRRVDLVYRRGEGDGTSDILLLTEDMKPLLLRASWGNTGSVFTGENEVQLGVTWGLVGGTEQLLGYHFTADEDFRNLFAHSLLYQVPFENRDTFTFRGAYVESGVDSAIAAVPVNLDGTNVQLSGDYRRRLPRVGDWRPHAHFGIDYKSTDNDLIFGGLTLANQNAEVFQLRIGYALNRIDERGYSRIAIEQVLSPGDVFSRNRDEDFAAFRNGASASYHYTKLDLEHGRRLPGDFTFRGLAELQYAPDPLLSTEQILSGGYRNLRGLPEYALRGDRGIRGQAELFAPPTTLFPGGSERLQLGAFLDGAAFEETGAGALDPGRTQGALSTGLALNLFIRPNLEGRAAYGHLLAHDGLDPEIGGGRFHFGLSLTY